MPVPNRKDSLQSQVEANARDIAELRREVLQEKVDARDRALSLAEAFRDYVSKQAAHNLVVIEAIFGNGIDGLKTTLGKVVERLNGADRSRASGITIISVVIAAIALVITLVIALTRK